MTSYGLASYDAVHAAGAIAAEADAIVTIDTGFALLPPSLLTVYTTAHGSHPAAASVRAQVVDGSSGSSPHPSPSSAASPVSVQIHPVSSLGTELLWQLSASMEAWMDQPIQE